MLRDFSQHGALLVAPQRLLAGTWTYSACSLGCRLVSVLKQPGTDLTFAGRG